MAARLLVKGGIKNSGYEIFCFAQRPKECKKIREKYGKKKE